MPVRSPFVLRTAVEKYARRRTESNFCSETLAHRLLERQSSDPATV